MKVSLNTVKQYVPVDLGVDELVERINQRLGGVEEVIDLADKYKDVVIVKVLSAVKHENADKLSVCVVDDGGVVPDIERDENGHVQVVCGAPNVHGDMYAAWLPPRATVPATYDDTEPFVLEARNLRGVMSNGMLAAADELAIGTEHSGIIEIDPSEWRPYDVEIKPGASFAAAYGLDDTVIEIENKMFTHRPDCFGQLGVAREIAGITGKAFEDPEWYWKIPQLQSASDISLDVFNEAPEKVPRFTTVVMKDVEIKRSPLWLQCALVAMGSKPINNVVDVTNYAMLLTAQPTHAYDYNKLRGHKLGARMARAGETVRLLNDKTYELTTDDIVIADGEGAVGLAGIMGGGDSEVSDMTTTVALEVATFDMYTLRKSSMRHGVFTDALARFNKGQSPLQNDRVIDLLIKTINDVSGAVQASDVIDLRSDSIATAYDEQSLSGTLKVQRSFINERLGLDLAEDDIQTLLRNVHFACFIDEGDTATSYVAPFWRTDIELAEDIVEEVGRLYGFDKLPLELPCRSIRPASPNARVALKQRIRNSLANAGANEVLTYSFVHEKILKNAGQNPEAAFQLSNALSPDLQYYRLSVLPSLLDRVRMNIKAGHDEFVLFEIGKSHRKDAIDEDGLPLEASLIDAVYANKKPSQGAAYYQMRRLVQQLCLDLGFTLRYKPMTGEYSDPFTAPFDPKRTALLETYDGTFIGIVGELKQTVVQAFKLPQATAAMSLDFDRLLTVANQPRTTYAPLSRFPSVTQDISLKVASDVTYEDVFRSVYDGLRSSASDVDFTVSPVTIYQAEDDDTTKTISLRVEVTSYERTLREDEVTAFVDAAAASANSAVSATRI